MIVKNGASIHIGESQPVLSLISAFGNMNLDTTIWGDDALEFKPTRFLANPKLASQIHTFGGGARHCMSATSRDLI